MHRINQTHPLLSGRRPTCPELTKLTHNRQTDVLHAQNQPNSPTTVRKTSYMLGNNQAHRQLSDRRPTCSESTKLTHNCYASAKHLRDQTDITTSDIRPTWSGPNAHISAWHSTYMFRFENIHKRLVNLPPLRCLKWVIARLCVILSKLDHSPSKQEALLTILNMIPLCYKLCVHILKLVSLILIWVYCNIYEHNETRSC